MRQPNPIPNKHGVSVTRSYLTNLENIIHVNLAITCYLHAFVTAATPLLFLLVYAAAAGMDLHVAGEVAPSVGLDSGPVKVRQHLQCTQNTLNITPYIA